jgi:hypothetical protein
MVAATQVMELKIRPTYRTSSQQDFMLYAAPASDGEQLDG